MITNKQSFETRELKDVLEDIIYDEHKRLFNITVNGDDVTVLQNSMVIDRKNPLRITNSTLPLGEVESYVPLLIPIREDRKIIMDVQIFLKVHIEKDYIVVLYTGEAEIFDDYRELGGFDR
jgi:hypothetical protein